MLRKELQTAAAGAAAATVSSASEEVIYKIDIPANRYDMLCLEGIARALNIFRGRQAPPTFRLADMAGACVRSPRGLACSCLCRKDGCACMRTCMAAPGAADRSPGAVDIFGQRIVPTEGAAPVVGRPLAPRHAARPPARPCLPTTTGCRGSLPPPPMQASSCSGW